MKQCPSPHFNSYHLLSLNTFTRLPDITLTIPDLSPVSYSAASVLMTMIESFGDRPWLQRLSPHAGAATGGARFVHNITQIPRCTAVACRRARVGIIAGLDCWASQGRGAVGYRREYETSAAELKRVIGIWVMKLLQMSAVALDPFVSVACNTGAVGRYI